ncbi:12700_t:CDS:2, partial [Gigaspora margarita]
VLAMGVWDGGGFGVRIKVVDIEFDYSSSEVLCENIFKWDSIGMACRLLGIRYERVDGLLFVLDQMYVAVVGYW